MLMDTATYGIIWQHLLKRALVIGSITNPPFRLAEEFVLRSLQVARVGVAVLARTVFLESVGRYQNLFRDNPPTKVAQFTERVPMVKGRLDKKASTATGYSWLVWEKVNLDFTIDLDTTVPKVLGA